jgi:hypothetical protein
MSITQTKHYRDKKKKEFKQPVFTKTWKSAGIFESYEAAYEKRSELAANSTDFGIVIKIKRCGDGGNQFNVKYWTPPKKA